MAPEPALSEFTLAEEEEMFEPEEPIRAIEPPPPIAPGARSRTSSLSPAPSSAQAATVLRASEARSTGALDWVRDRPVHALAIAGAIFGVFYGAYVYLQIFHPAVLRGDFLKQPLQAKAPPPAPKPIAPPTAPVPQRQNRAGAHPWRPRALPHHHPQLRHRHRSRWLVCRPSRHPTNRSRRNSRLPWRALLRVSRRCGGG